MITWMLVAPECTQSMNSQSEQPPNSHLLPPSVHSKLQRNMGWETMANARSEAEIDQRRLRDAGESGIWWINYYHRGPAIPREKGWSAVRTRSLSISAARLMPGWVSKCPRSALAARCSSRRSRRMLSSTRRSTKPRTPRPFDGRQSFCPSLARFPLTTLRPNDQKPTWTRGMI